MAADVSVVEGQVECVDQELDYEFGKNDLETNCTSPGVNYEAELCHSTQPASLGHLTHSGVGTGLELQDQCRNEVHAEIGVESSHCDEEGVS